MADEKLKARLEALPQMQQRNGIERGPILVREDSECPLPRGMPSLLYISIYFCYWIGIISILIF